MALWTPAKIETERWIDIADSATVFDAVSGGSTPIDGGSVFRVEDKSGQAKHATQATPASCPTYVQNGLGGLPVIRFTSGQFLSFASSYSTFGNGYCMLLSRESNGNIAPLIKDGVNYSYLHYGGNWFDGNISSLVTMSTNAWYSNISVAGARFSNGTAFGVGQDNASQFSQINIFFSNVAWRLAELIVFKTAISQENRQIVEGYLAWKWGTQSSLPANHPYKNAAPEAVGSSAAAVHFFTFGF